MRTIGYLRVSTADQAQHGVSLPAQKQAVTEECERRGWQLIDVAIDHASAKKIAGRPGLGHALDALAAGRADAMVVSRLDRLSRSVGDFAALMGQADREGWALIVMDPAVDMTTPFGRAMANMAATFAQLERDLISQRTREALAAKKARGEYVGGHPEITGATLERILELSGQGLGSRKIARQLDLEGYTNKRTDEWCARTVRRIVTRHGARPHKGTVTRSMPKVP